MTIGIFSHPLCLKHDMGEFHPECPARLTAIQNSITESDLAPLVQHFEATLIKEEWLGLAHCPDYIQYLTQNAPQSGHLILDADTSMMPDTLTAAKLSAGAVVNAVDKVMDGTITTAFCATRPPGHHAEYDKAMGFCFFNNVAIAARYAQEIHNVNRIAILDFDVHHGNGTENIIKRFDDILFCSTYQYPFYPFNVKASAKPPIINTPLDANATGAEFKAAVTNHWLPAVEHFKPELILVSAGFDAHTEDNISQVGLTDEDYAWVGTQIKSLASNHTQGRIVSVLEGGYALSALGRSVVAYLKSMTI